MLTFWGLFPTGKGPLDHLIRCLMSKDKVTLVLVRAAPLQLWGETGADGCVLMSVRHGSPQSMGQWLLTRPPCAGVAEEPAKLHSHAHSQSPPFYKLSFYVLSKDIRSLNLVMGVDSFEMTICSCKLIITPDCCAEIQEYKQYGWIKWHNHLC